MSVDLKIETLCIFRKKTRRSKCIRHRIGSCRSCWGGGLTITLRSQDIFVAWINEVYGPQVHTFLKKNDLSMKTLLILSNFPRHPSNIYDEILGNFKFIKVLYLPLNTIPILQPKDQQVICKFKKLYSKHLFRWCSENTNMALRDI